MEQEKIWDSIVIGGGAAGLVASIAVASAGCEALVLECEESPGKKLLITGGGHCNLAHIKATEKDFNSGNLRAVRNILSAFPVRKVKEFFRQIDVDLVRDADGKIFPGTRRAATVVRALVSECRRLGVGIETSRPAERIKRNNGVFTISGSGFVRKARTLIVATGGLSYPHTGSRGDGYSFAESFGHSVVPVLPSLVPLTTRDPDWQKLAGVSIDVRLSLVDGGKVIAGSKGPLLFTHQGFSGPAAMDLSGIWLRMKEQKNISIIADFIPGAGNEELLSRFASGSERQPTARVKKILAVFLPERFCEIFLKKSGIDPDKQVAHCSKKEREKILAALRRFSLPVCGVLGYDKAEVTSGGVALDELDPRTLGSKIVPGLFFAGEVLDVDGRIGGFNLHWAWASGYVTGQAAVARLKSGSVF